MSDNVEKFISILEKNKRTFYHFTDGRNIESIKEHGLLSTAELSRRGIKAITGGNDWSLEADKQKGMDVFVHLCFFGQHPMEFKAKNEGRIQNSRFLLIEPSILRAQGALISKDVSNKADAKYGNPNEFIEQIDLQVIYNRTDWKDKAVQERLKTARKYEILIPHHVATGLIRNL